MQGLGSTYKTKGLDSVVRVELGVKIGQFWPPTSPQPQLVVCLHTILTNLLQKTTWKASFNPEF